MNYENIKIKIGGVILPPPISLDYSYEDIDADSKRNTKDAVMNRNVMRRNVLKISITYAMNDAETISTVLQAVSPKEFKVELFDAVTNKRVTKSMYAGAKSMQFICNNNVWIKGLKFNLMEN